MTGCTSTWAGLTCALGPNHPGTIHTNVPPAPAMRPGTEYRWKDCRACGRTRPEFHECAGAPRARKAVR